jgi:hypothetical protein
LAWNDEFAPGEPLWAVAIKSSDCGSVGDPAVKLAWDFSDNPVEFTPFPSECYPFSIALNVDGQDIQPNQCVEINQDAQMSTMEARVTSGTIAGSALWSLNITYTRSCRVFQNDYSEVLSPSAYWLINNDLGSDVRGGMATLSCQSSVDPSYESQLVFWIRGLNPTEADAQSYINSRPNALWYYELVAKQEGGYQEGRWFIHFNEKGAVGENSCGHMGDIRHTPNWDGVCDPHPGFGMYQLTWFTIAGQNTREANAQELWNWKENVNTGTTLLRQHQSDADQVTDNYRVAAWIDIGSYTIPEIPVGDDGICLTDGTDKIAEHGVALKRYNGLGLQPNHDFVEYDILTHRWLIYSSSDYFDSNGIRQRNYYVDDVCSRLYD